MIKLLKKDEYFKTSDICLASALCCEGYTVETIDRYETSKATFFFKRNEFLDGILQLYFTHQLKVEPLSFFGFLRELKTRIYHT